MHHLLDDKRILDPISRISEVLFGLIMALTFTGSLSAAMAGREEVRTMLIGALGCNIAWGLIDSVMYLVSQLAERGRDLAVVQAVRTSPDAASSHRIITDALPPSVASTFSPADLDAIQARLRQMPEPPARPWLERRDFTGAVSVFLLVVLSTFPVTIPFFFMKEAVAALRASNIIAVVMLFLCGFRIGHFYGVNRWLMGLGMAIIGSILVGLTIALGG